MHNYMPNNFQFMRQRNSNLCLEYCGWQCRQGGPGSRPGGERAFREQREQQERLVREQAERDERLVRLKAEMEERGGPPTGICGGCPPRCYLGGHCGGVVVRGMRTIQPG